MRTVETRRPSFPAAAENVLLDCEEGVRWQVLCGDSGRWRIGVYSPSKTCREAVEELEWHDCPELFLLLRGSVSLLLAEAGRTRVLALAPGRPTLVTVPHAGFCPEGPHTGAALVVERDAFRTEYRAVPSWLALQERE